MKNVAERHFIVIGNGPAGNRAARTLRERAAVDRVTVVSKARQSCYSPHRLPDYIAGKIGEEKVEVCPFSEYRDSAIKLRCSQEAVSVDIGRRQVVLGHKEILPYDGLIIAVGGRPRIPERLSPFRDVLLTLKTIEDARLWIERLREADSVLLVGGDLTSISVAKALVHLRKKVTFLLDGDAFWPLRADAKLLETVSSALSAGGVEVLADSPLLGIAVLPGGGFEVQAGDWTLQPGLIGAFFGLVPDIGFLARSGLRIDRGILVDEYLNTGIPEVFAAGDCAQIFHPELRDYWVSVGYENALALGRVAASNLVGAGSREAAEPQSIFEVQGVRLNTSWWAGF
jgi:nitrite reductase (NADH) large subunit